MVLTVNCVIVNNIRDWEEENMDDEDPEGEQV
jgi:hypothetical protein